MKTDISYLILLTSTVFAAMTVNLGASPLANEMDTYLKENQFQGSVLIAKEGEILFSKGYGYANEEFKIENSVETVFRIGSITKQLTAVAILQLQEKGMLSVQDPIAKYLPGYPQGDKITIHHLLSHSSGISSITDFPNLLQMQRDATYPQKTIEHFKNLHLKFSPGTDCEYSDSGYIILGAIIEAVAKQSYEGYLQENILIPLGMNSTYYEHNASVIPNRASGYVKNEQGVTQHAPYVDMSFPHASGALSSTVKDLFVFYQALKGEALLKKESRESLYKIQASNANRKIAYGYGFRIGPQNRGMEDCRSSIVGHFGTIDGFEAALIRYLDDELIIILLSNREKTDVRSFHKDLARLVQSHWRPSAAQ